MQIIMCPALYSKEEQDFSIFVMKAFQMFGKIK